VKALREGMKVRPRGVWIGKSLMGVNEFVDALDFFTTFTTRARPTGKSPFDKAINFFDLKERPA